jgi:hypothetical protein
VFAIVHTLEEYYEFVELLLTDICHTVRGRILLIVQDLVEIGVVVHGGVLLLASCSADVLRH